MGPLHPFENGFGTLGLGLLLKCQRQLVHHRSDRFGRVAASELCESRFEAPGSEEVRAAFECVDGNLLAILDHEAGQRADADKHQDGPAQVDANMQADKEQGLEQQQGKDSADRHDRDLLSLTIGHEQDRDHRKQGR